MTSSCVLALIIYGVILSHVVWRRKKERWGDNAFHDGDKVDGNRCCCCWAYVTCQPMMDDVVSNRSDVAGSHELTNRKLSGAPDKSLRLLSGTAELRSFMAGVSAASRPQGAHNDLAVQPATRAGLSVCPSGCLSAADVSATRSLRPVTDWRKHKQVVVARSPLSGQPAPVPAPYRTTGRSDVQAPIVPSFYLGH